MKKLLLLLAALTTIFAASPTGPGTFLLKRTATGQPVDLVYFDSVWNVGTGLRRSGDTIYLNYSGVLPGTYGDATHVPQVTVDSFGRITNVSNVTISGSGGGGGGTVTSVGLALPASVFTVSGSPIVGSGTLTGSFVNQAPNTAFMGPASTTGPPTFRAFLPGDISFLTDSITAARVYALNRIHDTADTLRKYTRDRIKDSLTALRAASTLQAAYGASTAPQITTSTAKGALTLRRGSASDPDAVLSVQDGSGVQTAYIAGNGAVAGAQVNVSSATANTLARFDAAKYLTSYALVAGDIPALPAYVRRIGDTITGPIVGTTSASPGMIDIASTSASGGSVAIKGVATVGTGVYGGATSAGGIGVQGSGAGAGSVGVSASGTSGANGLFAQATGGGKAGQFNGGVAITGGGLGITSTTNAPISISHNLAGGFTHPFQAFNSGMVAGNQYNFDFGQSASTNNAGNFGFKYVGAGSSSNYVTLGLYGANDLLTITAAGVPKFSGLATAGFVRANASGQLSSFPLGSSANWLRGDGEWTAITPAAIGAVPSGNVSGVSQQVAYFTGAAAVTGSPGMTFNGVDLSLPSGSVKISTAASGILKADSNGLIVQATAPDFPILNQSTTGNAATATKWATARTLTIGATGKPIDGTGNQSWSLAEIGAQAAGSYQPLENQRLSTSNSPSFVGVSATNMRMEQYLSSAAGWVGYPGLNLGTSTGAGFWAWSDGGVGIDVAPGKTFSGRAGGAVVLSYTSAGTTLAGTTTLSALTGATTRMATINAAGQIGATSSFPLPGVTDGSGASSGIVGEIISASASGTSFTGTTAGVSLVSISLPAGSWLVWGSAQITSGASPSALRVYLSYSPTGTTSINANTSFALGSPVANSGITCHNAPTPINSSSTATVYLIGSELTTGAVAVNNGAAIYAQRIR